MISHLFTAGPSRASQGPVVRAAIISAVVLACLLPAAGCKSIARPKFPSSSGSAARAFAPGNHVDAGAIPASVRRVAVLPLHAPEWRAAEIATLDLALREELAGTERFEIAPVSRAGLAARFTRETVGSSMALPADFLAALRTDLGVDAVLFLDLTHFKPYQPIAIGVRAKLVTTMDGTVVWSFDSIFDSAQPGVEIGARRFSAATRRPAPAPEDNSGVLQSPARFAKYVGHEVFATLPPRQTE